MTKTDRGPYIDPARVTVGPAPYFITGVDRKPAALAVRACDTYNPTTGRCTHSDPAPAAGAHGWSDRTP